MNCKKCKNKGCVLEGLERELDYNCICYEGKTNGDRIRAMTDEELAEQMSVRLSEDCIMCPVLQADCPVWESKEIECKTAMLEWLRKEVEDG